MDTASDITSEEQEFDEFPIQVLSVTDVGSSSLSKKLIVRDAEGTSLEFVIFDSNPCSGYEWGEGDWYSLSGIIGHLYNGDPQLKPPYNGRVDIEPLNGKPDSADGSVAGGSDSSSGGTSESEWTGPTMLQTQLADRQSSVDVHLYKLDLDEGYDGDPESFTATVAARYRYEVDAPVVSKGRMRIVSTAQLNGSKEVDDRVVTPEYDRKITLDAADPRDNYTIGELVKQDIKQSLADDPQYDVKGIDTIVEREPTITSADGRFAAHRTFGVRVWVDSSGLVHCGIQIKHRFTSTFSAAEYMTRGHDIGGVRVEHDPTTYQMSGTGTIFQQADLRYTDTIPEIGETLDAFHVQKGRVDPQTAQKVAEDDPTLLYVDYQGGADSVDDCSVQAPQYLRIVPELQELKALDSDFHERVVEECRIRPDDRGDYAESFVSDIGYLSTLDTSIKSTFTPEGYSGVEIDHRSNNLQFANGHRNRTGKWGLEEYDGGVYKRPESFDVLAVYPERDKHDAQEYGKELVKTLSEIDAAPTTFDTTTYEYGSEFAYPQAVPSVTDYDAVLAVVPAPEKAEREPYADPYPVFKQQFADQRVPSQMVTVPQLDGNDVDRLNVAVGLVAAAGGIPWRIADLPGAADAFIGLDVHTSPGTDHYVGASANLVLADGTVFNSKAITLQDGEKFDVDDIVAAVRDLLRAYVSSEGEGFDHLVILRDGELYADLDKLEAKFSEIKGDVTLAEVRKSGAPRVVKSTRYGYETASKGTGFVHDDDDHAVLATTGAPEITDFGTPDPVRVKKRTGPADLETLCRQIYWLTEAHVGSVSRSVRVPVPIYYADKCAEAAAKGHLVTGQTINGLPYL